MSFGLIAPYLDVYLEIYLHPKADLVELSTKFEIQYRTLYNTCMKWIENGLVIREKKTRTKFRESYYEYSLSEKGTNLINQLKEVLMEPETQDFDTRLNQFLRNISISVDDKQRYMLKEKIINYFLGKYE